MSRLGGSSEGSFAAYEAGQLLTGLAGATTQPLERSASYLGNHTYPNLMPPIAAITDMFQKGHITAPQWEAGLRMNGAATAALGAYRDRNFYWEAYLEATRPKWGLSQIFTLLEHGNIDPAEAQRQIRSLGLRTANWHDLYAGGHFPLPAQQVIQQYRLRAESDDWLRDNLKWADVANPVKMQFLLGMDQPLGLGNLLELANRLGLNEVELRRQLAAMGWTTERSQNRLLKLRYVMPRPADLVLFALRDLFDASIVSRNRLLDEYPEQLPPLAESIGMNQELFRINNDDGSVTPVTLMQAHWAAHWRSLSPDQAFEMLHRLRPGRMERFRQQGLDVQPFTLDDVRRWLKVDDYPPGVRDYLAAVAFQPLRLADVYAALTFGVKDRAWAIEQYLDRGLHPEDAATAADIAVQRARERSRGFIYSKVKSLNGQTFTASLELYAAGKMNGDELHTNLGLLGVNQEEEAAYKDLASTVFPLRSRLKSMHSIDAMIDRLPVEEVQTVLLMYQTQAITPNDARQRLLNLGVGPTVIDRLLRVSQGREMARNARRQADQVARVNRSALDKLVASTIAAYREGIMLRANAATTLTRAGMSPQAVESLLSSADADAALAEVRTATASIRSDYRSGRLSRSDALTSLSRLGMSQPRALARLADWDAAKSYRTEVAKAEKIVAWVSKGLLPVQAARVRLANLGWSGLDTALLLADAEKALADRQAKAATQTESKKRAAANDLERLQKSAELQLKSLQSQIRRLTPPSTLKKWLLDSVVTEAYVQSRMRSMGIDDAVIANYLADWHKEAKAKGITLNGQVETFSNGQPADANGAVP